MKFKTLVYLLCVWPLVACEAGTVLMWSGETYKGRVTPEGGQIAIYPDQGLPTKVDLTKVRDAVFGDPQPVDPSQQPGVFLTNGDFVAGNARSLEDPVIKVESQAVPATGIAWIIFHPVPRDKLPVVAPGRTGAILPDGQFFEGTFAGIHDYHIGINSPLLGPQRFNGDQIAAVVMRDRLVSHSLYVITASNGSSYQTDDLQFDKEGVLFQDPILGPIKIKATDIREIASGGGRYQLLANVQPVGVIVPPGVDAADAMKVVPGADPGAPDTLITRANVAVSYTVPVGLTVFTATVGVPKDAPAGTHFTFAVYGDGGKFLIQRSLPIAVGDAPQTFKTDLNNVHTIVLRTEPAFPGSEKSSGQWVGPMLMRP